VGRNRYRIDFVDFGPPPPRASRGAQLQPAVDRYAVVLEQYARRHPLNWFNFYPYWAAAESRA
jgi:predicted LPLAT superfamily acyltransferase